MGAGMQDELLTERQAAELLQISPRTLRRWRYEKSGPPVSYVGKSPRYLRSEVLEWVRTRREPP
jgi:predicted DNA-binding transcriptional regulator AlpA